MQPKIGVSRCLAGDIVRYNALSKYTPEVLNPLRQQFTLIPVCPEVESGMPTPRPPARVEGSIFDRRFVFIESGEDATFTLMNFVVDRVKKFEKEQICGFVFKKGSPSCDVNGVGLFRRDGSIIAKTQGLFARAVQEFFPELPVADEQELLKKTVLDNFIQRALEYNSRF